MTGSTEKALRQEWAKVSAETASDPLAVPEDPGALGRRFANDVFDRYLQQASKSNKSNNKEHEKR